MLHRIWLIVLFLFSTLCANTHIEIGETWLIQSINQKRIDINSSKLALPVQVSKESLEILTSGQKISQLNESFILSPFEKSADFNTTEYISNHITSFLLYDKNISALVSRLHSLQNSDGGFGYANGYQSTSLDTAIALEALYRAKVYGPAVQKAISYLLSKQSSNGSWYDLVDDQSIYTTATVLRSLWLHRKNYNLQDYLDKGRNYLLSQKNIDGSYGELFESGLVLRSIAPMEYNKSNLQSSIDYLESMQQFNGSWGEDAFITALVLQALLLADKDVPNPDLGSLSGIIVDGDSGVALSGIDVELDGIGNKTTDNNGKFIFTGLQNGTYELNITSVNHAPLSASVQMNGDDINLGTLRLNKNIDATISTLQGKITDAASGEALEGVKVIIGQKETYTDSNGNYTIDSIEAGEYTLSMQKTGYLQESKNVTIPANTMLRYDLALRGSNFTILANLFGSLVDSETLEPLNDASITLKKGTEELETDSNNGNFDFKGIKEGDYRLNISKSGYQPVYAAFTIETTQNINFGVIKLTKIDENAPAFATIQGSITDIYSKKPIEGAVIEASGSTVVSAPDGSYVLENVPTGEVVLRVSKNDYLDASATATLTNDSVLIFSPALKPIDDTNHKLFGTIVDANTSEPLSDVNITITGAVEKSVYSDVDGYYIFEGLQGGEITVFLNKLGYKSIATTAIIADKSIEFSPTLQKEGALSGETTISGKVVDVATSEPLGEVSFYVNNVNTGIKSEIDGSFSIDNISSEEINLVLKKEGYKDASSKLYLSSAQELQLGNLYMRSSDEELKSNLVVEAINTSGLNNNISTFAVFGDLNVTVSNRGTVPSNGFDVYAFYDSNADGNFTEGLDRVFATHRFEQGLDVDSSKTVSLHVDTIADFREQPIYVYIDVQNENIELDENNLYSTAKSCGGKQGQIDLGICFDYSGSVGALANMQKNGLIQALKNPLKFPRDGSIRLTIMTATNKTYLNPTVITEQNAEEVATQMSNTYFSGNSYVDDCLRHMADKLDALPDQSSYKAITLSGDGRWGGSIAYDRDYAVSKGINVIDAIGVGNLNWTTLNTIVYPQPSGGELGVVRVAKTAEDISNSLMSTFNKQTEIPDLTLGKLEIIDNAADANISIRFTVGNSGVATIKQGTDISIYEGDPEDNGVLLTTTTLDENLSFGMSRVIRVDNIPLQEGGSIHVVGDSQNKLVECTKENNTISSIISATVTLGTISVQTDKSTYGANAPANLSANITNPGRLSYRLSAQLVLEDTSGVIMKTFPSVDLGAVASGDSRTISETWNSGTTLSGEYVLRGILYDTQGNVVDESLASFFITSGEAGIAEASLDLSTDKRRYNTSDSVIINNFIQNLSPNGIIPDATVALQIIDSNKTIVNSQSLQLSDLLPSSSREANTYYEFTGAPVGNYMIEARLLDGSGNVYDMDAALFEVYEDFAQSLRGSVSVAWNSELAGTEQVCSYKVTNFGSATLEGLPLELRVVDLSEPVTHETFASNTNLESMESIEGAESFITDGLKAGDYSCALYAKTGDTWMLLDNKQFNVEAPPVNLKGSIEFGGKGRLLVLLDPYSGYSHCNKPCGSWYKPCSTSGSASISPQRQYLENLLKTNGYSYTIVTDSVSFTRELRSGAYSSYALLSKGVTLPSIVQNELAEAVFMGEGLLVSGVHNSRNYYLYEPIGLKFAGIYDYVYGVEATSQNYSNFRTSYITSPSIVSFRTEGAELLAKYTTNRYARYTYPAAIKRPFGNGESIFIGFDILDSASPRPGGDYEKFLLEAIDDIYLPKQHFVPGDVVPMQINISNEGVDAMAKAQLTLSENAKFIDAKDVDNLTTNSLSFKEEFLSKGETKTYYFWVQVLHPQSEVELEATIFGNEVEQVDFTYSITSGTVPSMDAILTHARQIYVPTWGDYYMLQYAISNLTYAQSYISGRYYDQSLYWLLAAIGNLHTMVDKNAVKELRIMIDQKIREIEIKINAGEK